MVYLLNYPSSRFSRFIQKRIANPLEPLANLHRQLHEIRPINQAQQRFWSRKSNRDQFVFGLPNDDVARQQQSNVRIGAQCLVRDPRIADAENPITAFVNGKLLFEYRLHVDVADYSKPLFLQLARKQLQGMIEIRPVLYGKPICPTHNRSCCCKSNPESASSAFLSQANAMPAKIMMRASSGTSRRTRK
jgi:hypothetical protein